MGLSYSSVDIHAIDQNNPYARPVPTTSTTPAPVTTKKPGFFGGIRNYFRGDKTTVAPVTVPTTKASAPITLPPMQRPSSPVMPTPSTPLNQRNQPVPGVPTTSVPTPSVPQRNQPVPAPNFPAPNLPTPPVPQRNQPSPGAPPVPPRPTSLPASPSASQVPQVPPRPQSLPPGNAWNQGPPPSLVRPASPTPPPVPPRTPPGSDNFPALPNRMGGTTGPAVQFVPTTKPKSPSTTRAPTVGSGPATDAEITALTEALLTKDVNNPYKYITVNAQGRTDSSLLTDDAPMP